jgi:hypothetical protein
MPDLEPRSKGIGHGGKPRGYSWPPFEPGHELSTRHGAYVSPWRAGRRRGRPGTSDR